MQSQPQDKSLLRRVKEQELTAKKFGFYWEKLDQLIEKIRSECIEIQEAFQNGDQEHLQEEVGDLLQACISLAVFCQKDPEETLHKSTEKFQNRYNLVVKLAKEDGLENLHQQGFDVITKYWDRAKKIQRSETKKEL